jgi:hypothetical protein
MVMQRDACGMIALAVRRSIRDTSSLFTYINKRCVSTTLLEGDQNYFTDQMELEVMSYVETYQEATRVEIL